MSATWHLVEVTVDMHILNFMEFSACQIIMYHQPDTKDLNFVIFAIPSQLTHSLKLTNCRFILFIQITILIRCEYSPSTLKFQTFSVRTCGIKTLRPLPLSDSTKISISGISIQYSSRSEFRMFVVHMSKFLEKFFNDYLLLYIVNE